ncbi:MAG: citrate/2-methylcitrate synthase, partial [Armatimonadetes bacterium]|nr:citrate/2-methylcitrate synthase [Armatimonadota bacterium]
MSATTYPNYSPGLQGVIAGITTISKIVSETSTLTYRGVNVHDLAEKGSFEETAYLLVVGHLPNAQELADFKSDLARERAVPSQIIDTLRLTPKGMHPMDQLKVAY